MLNKLEPNKNDDNFRHALLKEKNKISFGQTVFDFLSRLKKQLKLELDSKKTSLHLQFFCNFLANEFLSDLTSAKTGFSKQRYPTNFVAFEASVYAHW